MKQIVGSKSANGFPGQFLEAVASPNVENVQSESCHQVVRRNIVMTEKRTITMKLIQLKV